jgi:hypothetical protein
MWESSDHSPIATALRESEEEIALSSDQVQVLGGLKEVCTRRMTWVRPVVGILSDTLSLQPNPDEIAALFTVPISFFRQDQRLRTDLFLRERGGKEQRHWVPAYQFGEYEIWGFTAAVIIELMNRCFTANIGRENSAPEKIW